MQREKGGMVTLLPSSQPCASRLPVHVSIPGRIYIASFTLQSLPNNLFPYRLHHLPSFAFNNLSRLISVQATFQLGMPPSFSITLLELVFDFDTSACP